MAGAWQEIRQAPASFVQAQSFLSRKAPLFLLWRAA